MPIDRVDVEDDADDGEEKAGRPTNEEVTGETNADAPVTAATRIADRTRDATVIMVGRSGFSRGKK